MLSPDTQAILAELETEQHTYLPNVAIANQLHDKTLIMLVGPSCIGKSTIIDEVVARNENFGVVGSFTTREPRPNNGTKQYDYIPNTDEGIHDLAERIAEKQVVQFAVFPTTKSIYGTDIKHYAKPYNLLDTLANAVEALRRLPFQECILVGVVAESQQWIEWFDVRFPSGHPDRMKRRDEAMRSLEWLLEQPMNTIHWIVNSKDQAGAAASRVIAVTEGLKGYDMRGPIFARAMLDAARDMKP